MNRAGIIYLLFNTLFKYDGKDIPTVRSSAPELASKLGPNATIISPEIEFSNYNTGLHYYDGDGIITNTINIWNSSNNALIYKTTNYTSSWSYDGNSMNAVLKTLKLSFDLKIQGANQVMWSKDKIYNNEGFLQQGLPGNVIFYYSLPRLFISGNLTFVDQSGTNKTIDVTGQGWVLTDNGENFKTEAWNWKSFRFDDGARLNLYNFANTYKVVTYQKPDDSTQWLLII